MRLPKLNISLNWADVLLANSTIGLIMKYGRTIQDQYSNRDRYDTSKRHFNLL